MLENVSLFSNIPLERLAQLQESCQLRKIPKNTILFMEGDQSGQLYIIESGLISVYTDGSDGKQLILNYLGPGDYFGELSLIDNKPRSASVMTIKDSQIYSVSRDAFNTFLKNNPDLYPVLMSELVEKIRHLTENVKDMALLDVYGRVAHTLERLSDESDTISLPKLTHQEIANMVGASREMVSRIMKELVVGGYIELGRNQIMIKKTFPKGW